MNKEEKEGETHIAIFSGKKIRRKLVENKWFFSVVDIVGVLTESDKPRDYWYRLKQREQESSGIELSTFCRQLKLKSGDGKEYETDVADTEGIFRIIQSIPSKKAEPFKRWLAKVGYLRNLHEFRFLMVQKTLTNEQEGFFDERIQEIEDPELAQERMKRFYELNGEEISLSIKRDLSL